MAERLGISRVRLLMVATLGGVTFSLAVAVLTLQLHLIRVKHGVGGRPSLQKPLAPDQQQQQQQQPATSAQHTSWQDLHVHRRHQATSGIASSANAYWNLILYSGALDWDALYAPDQLIDPAKSPANLPPNNQTQHHSVVWNALEQAAQAGHPVAQQYMAVSLASGIGPLQHSPQQQQSPLQNDVTPPQDDKINLQPSVRLTVPNQSFLYWRFSAMAGNVESMVSLAYHTELLLLQQQQQQQNTCPHRLVHWQEAANGIVDALLASDQSRGQVLPPQDGHVLNKIHMHGSLSPQLEVANWPNESPEALQYYQLRAKAHDVSAAYTLGQFYQHGRRGVSQNMTLALEYYTLAADWDHWEASGQVGNLHLWGLGTKVNLSKAYEYFQKGAPFSYESCYKRHQERLNAKLQAKRSLLKGDTEGILDSTSPSDVVVCDAASLNGLGLLHLWGIPKQLTRNVERAKDYFTLAKDMGNMDGAYHLAMTKLGWKTHFRKLEADEEGQSLLDTSLDPTWTLADPEHKRRSTRRGPTAAEIKTATSLLTMAANRGHVLARHRLGLLYTNGERRVAKDCQHALKHFKWIVDHASPFLSQRLRTAYQQYLAGDTAASLQNYLIAAEMGSEIAQGNAAFLLERGECLGRTHCAQASVRFWKAAAARGDAEACLRIGDYYYYGRRQKHQETHSVGPYRWMPYILYPEIFVPKLLERAQDWMQLQWDTHVGTRTQKDPTEQEDPVCTQDEQSCVATTNHQEESEEDLQNDLAMAAKYYRMAAEQHKSPRANFNLGFLHEWGLGLKQDFPLAKRHYDLAAADPSGEAGIAVQLSLSAMNLHELAVKLQVAWEDWQSPKRPADDSKRKRQFIPAMAPEVGVPVPPGPKPKSKWDIILEHAMAWDTLLITFLTIVVFQLILRRQARR